MSTSVEDLYGVTKELLNLLSDQTDHQTLDQTIEQINTLLDQREQLIKKLKPPYTENEQKIGQKIIKLDQAIEQQMNAVRSFLRKETKIIQQQKKSAKYYMNPYKDVHHIDGMFLDQKK